MMKKGLDIVLLVYIQLWITKVWDNASRFNITCSHPTSLVIDTTPLASSRSTTSEIANGNRATSLTKANLTTKKISGNVNVTTSTTENIQKRNITSVTTDASNTGNITITQDRSKGSNSEKKTTVIVVLAVIGVLLIAALLILVYVRRRQFANNIKRHEQDHCMLSSEQQNNPNNEEGKLDIPVNTYERLNMYVNDTLAGDMYQQLNADNKRENLEMNDVVTDSRNQIRNVTKEVKQEGQLKGQAKGESNNSNGEDRDTEISANAYERLNIYINDNLAGEMYEQLDANNDMPDNKDIQVKKSYHRTKQKRQAFAVYANAQ